MSDDYDDRKFDDALITQWRGQLGDTICTVKFTKENGEEREMKCTTNLRYIPEESVPENHDKKLELSRGNDRKLFVVFDTEKGEWRSFRYERVLTLYYPGNAPSNYPPATRVFP